MTKKSAAGAESPRPVVERVVVQVRAPSGNDLGQVTTGYYIVEKGMLTMTRPDGTPVDEDRFRHQLAADDNARAIAGVLTKQIRREAIGNSEAPEGFNDPLRYDRSAFA